MNENFTFSINKNTAYVVTLLGITLSGIGSLLYYIFLLQEQVIKCNSALLLSEEKLLRIEQLLIDLKSNKHIEVVPPEGPVSPVHDSIWLQQNGIDFFFLFKWLFGIIVAATIAGASYYVICYLMALVKTLFSFKTFFSVLSLGTFNFNSWFNYSNKIPAPVEFVDDFGYTIKIIYYLGEKSFDVFVKAPSTVNFIRLEDFIQKLLILSNGNNSSINGAINSLSETGSNVALGVAEQVIINQQVLETASTLLTNLNI